MRAKNMLFCVVSRKEIVEIKEIVSGIRSESILLLSVMPVKFLVRGLLKIKTS